MPVYDVDLAIESRVHLALAAAIAKECGGLTSDAEIDAMVSEALRRLDETKLPYIRTMVRYHLIQRGDFVPEAFREHPDTDSE